MNDGWIQKAGTKVQHQASCFNYYIIAKMTTFMIPTCTQSSKLQQTSRRSNLIKFPLILCNTNTRRIRYYWDPCIFWDVSFPFLGLFLYAATFAIAEPFVQFKDFGTWNCDHMKFGVLFLFAILAYIFCNLLENNCITKAFT